MYIDIPHQINGHFRVDWRKAMSCVARISFSSRLGDILLGGKMMGYPWVNIETMGKPRETHRKLWETLGKP